MRRAARTVRKSGTKSVRKQACTCASEGILKTAHARPARRRRVVRRARPAMPLPGRNAVAAGVAHALFSLTRQVAPLDFAAQKPRRPAKFMSRGDAEER